MVPHNASIFKDRPDYRGIEAVEILIRQASSLHPLQKVKPVVSFEEGKEPINKCAWNTISQEFIKEQSVVNSIKGLGKVDKESPNRLASIKCKCTTPLVKDCNESMAGGFALECTELVIVEFWLDFVKYPGANERFKNFGKSGCEGDRPKIILQ